MYIYGLYSTKDSAIRYVGQTRSSLKKRLKEHIYGALRYNGQTHKDMWIRKIYNEKHEIQIISLEQVSVENIDEREKFWIKQFPNLTNLTEGGFGGHGLRYKISYCEAKQWIRENYTFQSIRQFKQFATQEDYPVFLPRNVEEHFVLTQEWVSWEDFLGIQITNPNNVDYVSYEDAKKLLRPHKLKTKKEFLNYNSQLSKIKGNIIPNRPERYYSKRGWLGYADFLGYKKKYQITYELFVRYLRRYFKNIKSYNTYIAHSKKMHYCFPRRLTELVKLFPQLNWTDICHVQQRMTYEEAKEYLKDKNIKNSVKYKEYVKLNNLLDILPVKPEESYKNKGWVCWTEFLNSSSVKERRHVSYSLFRRYMSIFHKDVKNSNDYKRMFKEHKISIRIPKRPDIYFKMTWGELGIW